MAVARRLEDELVERVAIALNYPSNVEGGLYAMNAWERLTDTEKDYKRRDARIAIAMVGRLWRADSPPTIEHEALERIAELLREFAVLPDKWVRRTDGIDQPARLIGAITGAVEHGLGRYDIWPSEVL